MIFNPSKNRSTFYASRSWSTFSRCGMLVWPWKMSRKRPKPGKVKRREAYPYPCRKKVDHPASSENYLLATTCMLWKKILSRARSRPIFLSLVVHDHRTIICKRLGNVINWLLMLQLCSCLHFFWWICSSWVAWEPLRKGSLAARIVNLPLFTLS